MVSKPRGNRPPARGRLAAARSSPQGGGARPRPDRPQGQPPEGGRLQRGARKGRQPPATTLQGLLPMVYRRPPAASPQGAADCGFGARRKASCGQRHRPQGLLPARVVASSACGGASRMGGRPLAEWLPAGKGSRRLRSDSGGTVRVKEG
ncbi:hypothetical protein BHE74_00053591 [Ensete ventricosum]|nr:hypothetical protein BHE74_00053591 [Ensete ventricosum]